MGMFVGDLGAPPSKAGVAHRPQSTTLNGEREHNPSNRQEADRYEHLPMSHPKRLEHVQESTQLEQSLQDAAR